MQWNDTEIRGEIDPQRLAIVLKKGSKDARQKVSALAVEAGLKPEVLEETKRESARPKLERIAPSDRLLWVTGPDAYARRKDLAERVARLDARVSPVFIGALGADTLFSRFTVDPWVVDVHPTGVRTLLLLGHGVEIEPHWPVAGWFRARLLKPVDDFAELARATRKMARLSFRSYPLLLPVAGPETEPSYAQQWSLQRVRSQQMWTCGTCASTVKVFVLDIGVCPCTNEIQIDPSSVNIDEDLGGGTYGGDGQPMTNDGHGTGAAGVIGARALGSGITGIAPNCTLVSLRCNDGTLTQVFQAMNYAAAHLTAGQRGVIHIGFDVLRTYANGPGDAARLVDALNIASTHDLTVVIPSGNYSSPADGDHIPAVTPLSAATKPFVIVTGASLRNDADPTREGRLDYTSGEPGSRYGAELSLVAPGMDVYSTTAPAFSYASDFAGTSIAAAHVAGVAAVVRAIAPGMTAPDVKTLLLATATPVAGPTLPAYAYASTANIPRAGYRNDVVGVGRLDAASAAAEAHLSGPLSLPAAPTFTATTQGTINSTTYTIANATAAPALARTARVRLDLVRGTGPGSHSLFSFSDTTMITTRELDVAAGTSQNVVIFFAADNHAPSTAALADLLIDSNDVRATPGTAAVRNLVATITPACQCV